ncbi:MAG: tetratricopeptide repeat protein [Magnetococcales bacterium]|nr:tetratricopeptide repeat protein [Magnetococcales bacterium]
METLTLDEALRRAAAHRLAGAWEEAEALFHAILQAVPGHPEACHGLGLVAAQSGRVAAAIGWLMRALEADPGGEHHRLAFIDTLLGAREEARRLPEAARLFANLGVLLHDCNRDNEAETALREAIALRPDYALAHYNLGVVLHGLERPEEAASAFRAAIRLRPEHAQAHANLGVVLHERNALIEAEACLREALRLQPDYAEAWSNLANTLTAQCRLDEAEACCRRALALHPDGALAMSNLLFGMLYHPDRSLEELRALHVEYDTRFIRPVVPEAPCRPVSPDPRRVLRVGYVSRDFGNHSIRGFLEPLLACHDKSRFEIHAYADGTREDEVTRRYQGYADHWVATAGMSDAALAARIREDGIDLLVDLSGHTARNRLRLFAHKPAPLSVTWMYGFTTGVSAIDYLLTDALTDPPGAEALYVEKLWRVPAPAFAYRPAEGMGEVSRLPALERGYVTFGNLGRSLRHNDRVLRVWAAILHRVPGARLVIHSANYRDAPARAVLYDRFAALGIGRERLDIGFSAPPWETLRGMDIGLDGFPLTAGITLAEPLYMGLPMVCLMERFAGGGLGRVMLTTLGHPEWLAGTEEEYVELAVGLAADLPRLARLRAGLREAMRLSPLMDEAGFARKVEDACRAMWREWLAANG